MTITKFRFTDRARPICELGIGDTRIDVGTGRWDVSRWDEPDATWAGTEPLWLDIGCDVHEAEHIYGRQRATDRFAPGSASLVVNNSSGWADPTPPAGDPALLPLRTGRSIRIGIDHAVFGRLWKWRGVIDAVEPRYDPVLHDVADITAVCALGDVGRVPIARLGAPVGADELGGTRINRILNAARWPAGRRSVEQTGVPMLATTLGAQAADLLAVTADSVGGAVYGDTEGRVVFRGRDWQTYEPSDPNDGTIGNIDASDVCPSSWQLSDRRVDIVTQTSLGRETDVEPIVRDDVVGQAQVGIEPYEVTDLMCRDTSQLTRLSQRLFRTRSWRLSPRVERVHLDAATAENTLDLMSTVDVFGPSRYRCRLRQPRGDIFDREMLVSGVRHYMTRSEWTCDLDLDVASPWAATAGRWDEAYWDLSRWSGFTRELEEVAA